MNKDNYLWVIEEYYDNHWSATTMCAWTRDEARTLKEQCGNVNYRIRKYIRQEK